MSIRERLATRLYRAAHRAEDGAAAAGGMTERRVLQRRAARLKRLGGLLGVPEPLRPEDAWMEPYCLGWDHGPVATRVARRLRRVLWWAPRR